MHIFKRFIPCIAEKYNSIEKSCFCPKMIGNQWIIKILTTGQNLFNLVVYVLSEGSIQVAFGGFSCFILVIRVGSIFRSFVNMGISETHFACQIATI